MGEVRHSQLWSILARGLVVSVGDNAGQTCHSSKISNVLCDPNCCRLGYVNKASCSYVQERLHSPSAIVDATRCIEMGLHISSLDRSQVLEPCLSGPEPILVTGNEFVTLTDRANAEDNDFGTLSWGSRINRRSAIRAERLLTFVSALSGLDINFR